MTHSAKKDDMTTDLVAALLQTQALRIAPPGEMFWYTSGTIGPYYINTHYLYGNPTKAEDLLKFIDGEKEDRNHFPPLLAARTRKNYATDEIYRHVVDALVGDIQDRTAGNFDYISGGERRDWFFSPAVAEKLDKPHLLIYKDLSVVLCSENGVAEVNGLEGKKTVHIADLVTEASSYFRSWMPAIQERGGRIDYSLNVVDRAQGGTEALKAAGLDTRALLRVDEHLFDELVRSGIIAQPQREMLTAYYHQPDSTMKTFLQERPDFLQGALASADERTAARARILVDENPYGLDLTGLAP